MKILHIVHNYYPSFGGAQEIYKRLSEYCVANYRDDVTVFTTNALLIPNALDTPLLPPGEEMFNGVRVHRFAYWRKSLTLFKYAVRYANRWKLPGRDRIQTLAYGPISGRMLRAVAKSDADVICCMAFPYMHMYYPLLAESVGGRRRPVVYLGALHLEGRDASADVIEAIARADAYVAFTTFERDYLIARGIDAAKIHVIGLGVDPEVYRVADGNLIRHRYGIEDELVVGFIGRQAIYKGVDTLVHAMKSVWEEFPTAYCVLAGARTNFSDQLERLIASLPEEQRARVVQCHDIPEEEKASWFAACDVFASVSKGESFGISYLEAWACGKPVIGARIGAVSCVIKEGEDGFLVPYGDSASLAIALKKLLGDAEMRRRFGTNGLAKVTKDYTWTGVIERIRKVYESVVGRYP